MEKKDKKGIYVELTKMRQCSVCKEYSISTAPGKNKCSNPNCSTNQGK